MYLYCENFLSYSELFPMNSKLVCRIGFCLWEYMYIRIINPNYQYWIDAWQSSISTILESLRRLVCWATFATFLLADRLSIQSGSRRNSAIEVDKDLVPGDVRASERVLKHFGFDHTGMARPKGRGNTYDVHVLFRFFIQLNFLNFCLITVFT